MLVIRTAQLDALAEGTLERRIVDHLREHFPRKCEGLDSVTAFVREGIAKARSYGFTYAPHLCQFVDLLMMFGRDLDTDPRHAWAGDVLRDPEIDHPGTRMILLVEEAERLYLGGAS